MTTHPVSTPLSYPRAPAITRAPVRSNYPGRRAHRAAKSGSGFVCSAHARFARALGRNGIAWLYKPRTFAIDWDADGNLLDSITPDFYLPDYDQYIELAAPEEHRISAKKRRLRMLSQVHAELNIRLIADEDFAAAIRRLVTGRASRR